MAKYVTDLSMDLKKISPKQKESLLSLMTAMKSWATEGNSEITEKYDFNPRCGICVNMVHNLTDRSILPHPWVFAQTWEYSYKNHGGFSYPIEAALDIPHWMHFSTNKWEGERLKYRLLYIDHIIGCIERGTVQPDIPRWEKSKLSVIAFFKGK